MPPHFQLGPSVGALSNVVGAGSGGVHFATNSTLLDVVAKEAFGHGGAANIAQAHGQHIRRGIAHGNNMAQKKDPASAGA
jgi:hypothetical protein